MMSRFSCCVVLMAVLVPPWAAASGQTPPPTLAQAAARAAEAQQKAGPKPARVFTNADLRHEDEAAPVSPAAKPEGTPPPPAPGPAAGRVALNESYDMLRDEPYWKNRMRDVDSQALRSAALVVELRGQVARLTRELEGSSGFQRVVANRERLSVSTELTRAIAAAAADAHAVELVREEARRARVPPGWLRY